MPFLSDSIQVCSDRPTSWSLLAEVVYAGRDEQFVVPIGFKTDFASVPIVFTWLIPRYGTYTRAAILHDFLCRPPAPVNYADADGIFRRVLRELGVSLPRRWMMWGAVRVGHKMSDATREDWLRLIAVALIAVPALIIPLVVVQLWIWIFKVIEWVGRVRS